MAKKKSAPRRKARKPARRPVPATVAAPVPQPAPVQAAPAASAVGQMKSIWYMVGLVLLAMGGLIFATGVYLLIEPSSTMTSMSHLQPDLWWGAVMVVFGGIFVVTHRNKTHAV